MPIENKTKGKFEKRKINNHKNMNKYYIKHIEQKNSYILMMLINKKYIKKYQSKDKIELFF